MFLPLEEVEQFFRLHRALMFFVNRSLRVLDEEVATPEAYSGLPPETRIKVHEALLDHPDLIDAFADENPSHFDEPDLAIVRSWTHLLSGTFYAFRQLSKHMVFLTDREPIVAYGVVALFDPFEDLIGPYLPRMVKTTLLPFKDRIVYDGLMTGYNVSFGPGIRRRLSESYMRAKERFGIVTRLPFDPGRVQPDQKQPEPGRKPARVGRAGGRSQSAEQARRAHDEIVGMTDAFCRQHLDDEYGALCRKLAGVLARKRPLPLTRGKPESWASGIVRVIGWANFLGDPSRPHHMKMTDIDETLGVSEATGSAKSKAIRDVLKIRRFDPEWTVPSRMDQNPLAWLIQVNGLMVDARQMPRAIQEEAHRNGLIPYVPGERAGDPEEE